MEEKKNQIVELALTLQRQDNAAAVPAVLDVSPLTADGSQRQFLRMRLTDGSTMVAVFPHGGQCPEREEARSAWLIGRHLLTGVPVPSPLACDQDSGLILFEDLGDTRLYDQVPHDGDRFGAEQYESVPAGGPRARPYAGEGGRGFDLSWCWQTPRYDRQLMLERESGYFLQALCRDFLEMDTLNTALQEEFKDIADHAVARRPIFSCTGISRAAT